MNSLRQSAQYRNSAVAKSRSWSDGTGVLRGQLLSKVTKSHAFLSMREKVNQGLAIHEKLSTKAGAIPESLDRAVQAPANGEEPHVIK